MKYVANLLVAIHNVASAEAMVLGMKAGLDPKTIHDLVTAGAGTSRVFELRAPMMVKNDYDDATMKISTWQKDMAVIGDYAAQGRMPDAAVQRHLADLRGRHVERPRGARHRGRVCGARAMAGVSGQRSEGRRQIEAVTAHDPKSGNRFSEKIMLRQKPERDAAQRGAALFRAGRGWHFRRMV